VRYDHGYPGLGLGLVGSEGVELQGKEFARLPRGVRLATAAPEIMHIIITSRFSLQYKNEKIKKTFCR
jgi:hypothetical protein